MKYVLLGRTGTRVSRICLGTAFRGQWDDSVCRKVIDRSLDIGINFIDTSNVYGENRIGHAEKIIGEAVKDKRDQVVIATKIYYPVGDGVNDYGLGRVHLMREIDNCLKRLQTDCVDVLYLHEPDSQTPLEVSLSAADAIVRQGKARHIGLSRYSAWKVEKALGIAKKRGFDDVAVLQDRYNLIYREAEMELLPFLSDSGMALTVCCPLAIGLLTGCFRYGKNPSPETLWGSGYKGFQNLMTEQTDRVVQELEKIGKEHCRTTAQTALAWLLAHAEVTSVVIGPDNLEQLEENARGDFDLSPDEMKKLNDLSAPMWAKHY